jgi:hypothetical protein
LKFHAALKAKLTFQKLSSQGFHDSFLIRGVKRLLCFTPLKSARWTGHLLAFPPIPLPTGNLQHLVNSVKPCSNPSSPGHDRDVHFLDNDHQQHDIKHTKLFKRFPP